MTAFLPASLRPAGSLMKSRNLPACSPNGSQGREPVYRARGTPCVCREPWAESQPAATLAQQSPTFHFASFAPRPRCVRQHAVSTIILPPCCTHTLASGESGGGVTGLHARRRHDRTGMDLHHEQATVAGRGHHVRGLEGQRLTASFRGQDNFLEDFL